MTPADPARRRVEVSAAVKSTLRIACSPALRELAKWCLPALLLGLALRALIQWQLPYGHYHADSPDFLLTADRWLAAHRLELHAKKTFLAPIAFTIPFLLRIPALIAVPAAQHLLGLAAVVVAGALCRLWLTHWRWAIIPVTIAVAADPSILWYEHTLMAESLFVFCTLLLALAGTLYALKQSVGRFGFLCATLFLEAGARPEGKLFLLFGVGLTVLLHRRELQLHVVRLACLLLLAVVTHAATKTSQAGLLLYTSVARLTPKHLDAAPGFNPYIAPERKSLEERWNAWPSFPRVADRRIIDEAVTRYLSETDGQHRPDSHRAVNDFCLKLAVETCWRNLYGLPGYAYHKFRTTATEFPGGLFDREWLFDHQYRAYRDADDRSIRLAQGLTGDPIHDQSGLHNFVDRHYREIPWFNAFAERWQRCVDAIHLPDATFNDPISGRPAFIYRGIPAYFIAAALGLAALAVRPGPLRLYHAVWGAALLWVFFVVMLTANVKPRFRFVFEPFWILYLAAAADCVSVAARNLWNRRKPQENRSSVTC